MISLGFFLIVVSSFLLISCSDDVCWMNIPVSSIRVLNLAAEAMLLLLSPLYAVIIYSVLVNTELYFFSSIHISIHFYLEYCLSFRFRIRLLFRFWFQQLQLFRHGKCVVLLYMLAFIFSIFQQGPNHFGSKLRRDFRKSKQKIFHEFEVWKCGVRCLFQKFVTRFVSSVS